ncbi:MAG: hypothetical protein JXB45_05800 [Candidatus Krumholzibacteriota bacterium]|nr:hypothetical protein [Candidatus Krumholzibacteriota bacterium]
MDADRSREKTRLPEAIASLVSIRRGYLTRGAVSIFLSSLGVLFSLTIIFQQVLSGWRYTSFLCFVCFWTGILSTLVFLVLFLHGQARSPSSLAETWGRQTGRGTLFSAALEFSGEADRLRNYSSFLMAETVKRALRGLDSLPVSGLFAEAGKWRWTLAGIMVCLLLLAQVQMAGEATRRTLRAIIDPGLSFRQPRSFHLRPRSGDSTILAGEGARVEVSKFGSLTGEVSVRFSSVPGIWKREVMSATSGDGGERPLEVFAHDFINVREGMVYYFEAGRESTPRRTITVVHRPIINRVGAILYFPPYTGLEPDSVRTLAGKIVAPAGTRVELKGETSHPVAEARIEFNRAGVVPLRPGEGGFEGGFMVAGDDTLRITVTDSMNLRNENAVRFPVVSLRDRPPTIEIISPGEKTVLPRSLATGLLFRGVDEYGLAGVDLRFMKEGKDLDFKRISLPLRGRAPVRVMEDNYDWRLDEYGLFPGDRILYYLEAWDNNTRNGPGRSRTETRTLIVPSLADLYARAREEENLQHRDMDEIMEQGQEIKERLKKLSDDFKAEGEMDWSRRNQGMAILDSKRQLQEKIQEVTARLDQTLGTLEANRMTSQDIGEKMEEIQRLLQRIESEDLRRAIDKLQQMMDSVPEEELNAELGKLELSLENMMDNLDRTINLLKQVLKEEKMEELVRRLEDMLEEQRALRDSARTGEREEMSEKQEDLQDEFGKYRNDWEDFTGEEADSALRREMEKASRKMEGSGIDSLMGSAASELEEGDREQAQCSQSEALNRLLSLYTEMGRCQAMMSMSVDPEIIRMVERSARELVEASQLEEEMNPALSSPRASGELENLLQEQLFVREAVRKITHKLFQAARGNMNLSPSIFLHLGLALARMNDALEALESRKFATAATAAQSVSLELNRSVIELLQSSASSGGSGGGARQKMQSMLQRQMAIDEQLKMMLEGGGNGALSLETRARMKRLAAEQRKMRQLMEQIAEESGGAGELLGRLDDISSEMEAVAGKLENSELDEELLRREQRVLTRMLDSQRSLNRRDYKRERTSRPAGDLRAVDSGELVLPADNREMLLERIRRAMQEKGPAEYEELIRQYYRALSGKIREKN